MRHIHFHGLPFYLARSLHRFRHNTYPEVQQYQAPGAVNQPEGPVKPRPLLQTLPQEPFDVIVSHLPPLARAALALTSRTMFSKQGQGKAVFRLSEEDRYALCQLLEEDGVLPAMILCSVCRLFHLPRMPPRWLATQKGRSSKCPATSVVEDNTPKKLCEVSSTTTECVVAQSTVAGIMRSFKLSNGAVYPIQMLSYEEKYVSPYSSNVTITVRHNAGIRRGRLILRREWTMQTGYADHAMGRGVQNLMALVHENPFLAHACVHINWTDELHCLLHKSGRSSVRNECVWAHDPSCADAACGWGEQPFWGLWGCNQCYMDYSVHRLDQNRIRMIRLTTWRDVGEGERADDEWWTCHVGHVVGRRERYPVGNVKRVYERVYEGLW